MSTVTIRMESHAGRKSRLTAQLLIDGRLIDDVATLDMEITNDAVQLSPSVNDPADVWPVTMRGELAFTVYVDGAPVMVSHDQPERAIINARMVEYTWRNVGCTLRNVEVTQP